MNIVKHSKVIVKMSLLTLSSCLSLSRCQRRSAFLWMSTRQRIVASRCNCCSSPTLSQISSFLCSWSDTSISWVSNVCVDLLSGKWTLAGAVLVSVVSVFCSSCEAVGGVDSGWWVSPRGWCVSSSSRIISCCCPAWKKTMIFVV